MTCNCPPKNIIVYFFKSSAKPFNHWHNALSLFFFFHKANSVLSTFITSHCPLTMWCIWLGYQLEKAFSTPESKLNGLKVIKDGKELNCLATTFQQKGKTHKQITKIQPPTQSTPPYSDVLVLHICDSSAWETRGKRTIQSYTVAWDTLLHREKLPQKSDQNKTKSFTVSY